MTLPREAGQRIARRAVAGIQPQRLRIARFRFIDHAESTKILAAKRVHFSKPERFSTETRFRNLEKAERFFVASKLVMRLRQIKIAVGIRRVDHDRLLQASQSLSGIAGIEEFAAVLGKPKRSSALRHRSWGDLGQQRTVIRQRRCSRIWTNRRLFGCFWGGRRWSSTF